MPDHPGTESIPTVDAILDAFWDEGITDLPHLDSHSTGFVKRKKEKHLSGSEEGGQSIFIHMFYLFDSEEEAEDRERTVSSAPMGDWPGYVSNHLPDRQLLDCPLPPPKHRPAPELVPLSYRKLHRIRLRASQSKRTVGRASRQPTDINFMLIQSRPFSGS